MILQSLLRYHSLLSETPDSPISKPGYSSARVSFALILNLDGELIGIEDRRTEASNGKLLPRIMSVPLQKDKASGIFSNFLCEKPDFVLGLTRHKQSNDIAYSKKKFDAMHQLHHSILDNDQNDSYVKAFLAFIDNWQPDKYLEYSFLTDILEEILSAANLVFRFDGQATYLHNIPVFERAWKNSLQGSDDVMTGQCLVTGRNGPVARIHNKIRGVNNAHTAGASIVSFNQDSFKSYNKDQNFNAPMNAEVAAAYVEILNYLLRTRSNRLMVGDTTTVFWAEKMGGKEEGLFARLLGIDFTKKKENESADKEKEREISDVIAKVTKGEKLNSDQIDESSTFNLLGLSPNAGRLAIRFFYTDTYGNLLRSLCQHQLDMQITHNPKDTDYPSLYRLLIEMAPLLDKERIPPLLAGELFRCILNGTLYPTSAYTTILSRIRADFRIGYARAAFIKAYLNRKRRLYEPHKEPIPMTLNEQNPEPAYRLGRLFALLEKIQKDAIPNINASIKDRYFSSASASPGSVFPILLRGAQNHLSKIEYGHFMDKLIQDVVNEISCFPKSLNLDEQGLFVLGYYHQKADLYTKKEKEDL